jgi:hypothetical protein
MATREDYLKQPALIHRLNKNSSPSQSQRKSAAEEVYPHLASKMDQKAKGKT